MNRMLALAVLVVVALVPRPGAAADAAQQEANKKAVVEFYDKAINQKDFGAASAYPGPRYTQHNPNAADGPEGLKAFLLADGDYVILHVHAVREPGARGNAIVDIFKLENGKIVEHWDVVQPIPEKAANSNGMF
jgi:predicted SnoaL-like aldol condensation-catalyzing enzyme